MTRPCPSRDYDFRPPRIKPPPGACCTRAHAFCSADRFPYAEGRGYIPPYAPNATCLDRLDSPGLDQAGLAQLDAVGICGIRLSAMLKGRAGSDQLCGFGA